MNFFSRYFNLVLLRKENKLICKSCETLKEQLEISNANCARLLNNLIELNTPNVPSLSPPQNQNLPKPILPKVVPWHIQREMMENEDRKRAQLLKEKEAEMTEASKSIAELEKEMGIDNAS